MKFIHLADLHIGKRLNGFSLLDDQKYILTQILKMITDNNPDAIFIAGDIYDTPLPPVEAVRVFDKFLTALAALNLKIFIISGNHDSADRLAFGANLLVKSNVYIAAAFTGDSFPLELHDQYGKINIYMLPFIKPIHAKKIWPNEEIHTYEDAVRIAVKKMDIDQSLRNIIIAHQFVTGAKTSDSEEICVGGLDNISADLLTPFDYAAMGHIHRPQKIGFDTIRYAGTPLKYSFSEATHKKVLTIVELKEKGDLHINLIPLTPLHDMREISGSYAELVNRNNYIGTPVDDYLSITLTDETEIPDAIGKLRTIYPNIMKINYDNTQTRTNNPIINNDITLAKSPADLLESFYLLQNNHPLSSKQQHFANDLIKQIWEAK
ncbi:exonuclease SbcCD subunit D [Pectinatus frisingensis]|uniref:exonuclease SbcCD subunit D n=1 Tax=Pectinatus frisingensis TaxID=865 RepID=UPI0018C7C12A|nr:exonuclease SbcCD subunit D [Pectinatus frisingensis]